MRNYIYAYDYDSKTGDLSNRRVHIDAIKAGGYDPKSYCDGLCVDTDGGIWSARFLPSDATDAHIFDIIVVPDGTVPE